MSFQKFEVELDHGLVRARGAEQLPIKAQALLTILNASPGPIETAGNHSGPGLRHFLSPPDFALTSEQLRSSMESDFWEQ